MEIKITYRGLDQSKELDNHIHEQLKKIEISLEHVRSPIILEVVIERYDVHKRFQITLRLRAPMLNFLASHEGPDLYAEINHACDVLHHRIREAQQKLVDDKRSRTKA